LARAPKKARGAPVARPSIVHPRGPGVMTRRLPGAFFGPEDVSVLAKIARCELAAVVQPADIAEALDRAAGRFVSAWRLEATMNASESEKWAAGIAGAVRDVMDRLGFPPDGGEADIAALAMLTNVRPRGSLGRGRRLAMTSAAEALRAEGIAEVVGRLPMLANAAKRAAAFYADSKTGKRPPYRAERDLIRDFAGVFQSAFGRRPGIANDPANNEPGGPTVRFMAAALAAIADRDNVAVTPHPNSFRDCGRVDRLRELASSPHHALASLIRMAKRAI
jgi:hypothetical protein